MWTAGPRGWVQLLSQQPARISVVGVSGCGKTTFAPRLAAALGLQHLQLDALRWLPGWKRRSLDDVRSDVAQAAAAPGWVIDGNCYGTRDLVWGRATHVLWLDIAFLPVSARVLKREVRRIWGREEPFPGCRYTWQDSFLSKHSFPRMVSNRYLGYRRHRQEFLAAADSGRYPGIIWVQLRSQKEADRWVEEAKAWTSKA